MQPSPSAARRRMLRRIALGAAIPHDGRVPGEYPELDLRSEDLMSNVSTKELQDNLVAELKNWQKAEGTAANQMEKLGKATDHPIIKLVADVIHADSLRHAKVQQLVIDSIEKGTLSLSPDDLGKVWGLIDEHIKTEQHMVADVRKALDSMRGRKMVVQQYLLEYLLFDEEKHDLLLEKLEGIKGGMYPYG